jgi:hypothetical protein
MKSKELNIFLYFSMIYNLLIALLIYKLVSTHVFFIYHKIILVLFLTNIFAVLLIRVGKLRLGCFWLVLFSLLSLFLHLKYSLLGWSLSRLPFDILFLVAQNLSLFVLLVFYRKQIFKKEKND